MPTSSGDPDIDAVMGAPAASATPSSGDPDIAAVMGSPTQTVAAPKSVEPRATWLGAARGVGDAGLALGAGGLKSITHAVNDLLPGSGRAEVEQDINQDPILNYQPQTEEGKYLMGKIRSLMSPVSAVANTAHDYLARTLGNRTADVAGDVVTLAPFMGRIAKEEIGTQRAASSAIESGHPLSEAAEAESKRLGSMKAAAEERGYSLPEGGPREVHADAARTNTPLVNADSRAELNLPKNAPMTPQMLEAGRQKFGAPGFQNVANLKDEIPLDRAALDEARTANMNATPNERLPFPQGDSISGAQAVDFSKKARYLANQLEKNSANPFARQDAQMYRDAAEAVENSVGKHLRATGRGDIAEGWDSGRVYYAKSYSVENALDGAGNVRAGDLKTQLFKKGKPLSGNLETVANLAAQYPEAFQTTRVTQPAVGTLRKVTAGALPLAGTAIGGALGGTWGGVAGDYIGRKAGERVLQPR